ncbi:site-specific tyrosine recombinase/integron integrase [Paraeggerthella hongkongensis]|uniref:Integrase n=1 Tax=Paraeggerthella hongkongensis TaxID=230658 RepID=A0A3N0B8C4_9ACTN|nr:site-specific tyrosine recombinase/integron integrase [Paraeggerthella hongkongensis]RNL43203.1 integrase [Paraeggerthella hongkongensis]
MNDSLVAEIANAMTNYLDCSQMRQLKSVLRTKLDNKIEASPIADNSTLIKTFLQAKALEGCSQRTTAYYESTLQKLKGSITKSWNQINTDDLRQYLTEYQTINSSSKVTIDNIRRIFSSFFSWLEDEDYIAKSPVRRIHRVKAPSVVKETISDEDLESLRDACPTSRDLAIVDLLTSTGMRVGELVGLNKSDINLNERECIVFGKGAKERKVYFDARTKIHLSQYLNNRADSTEALFVSLNKRATRITIGTVESRLRQLGRQTCGKRIHPHKFRRTLATAAIDKGMPIEQVQKLLGHVRIDTTMQYALVSQSNVKASHRKYLG